MTETEWQACSDPSPMLDQFGDGISDRKLRLLVCACCRQVWDRLRYPTSRRAVEVAEQFADGRVSAEELDAVWVTARVPTSFGDLFGPQTEWCDKAAVWSANRALSVKAAQDALQGIVRGGGSAVQQAALLRELFGCLPFRALVPEPAWLTNDVRDVAEAIYHERAFDRLPILADALADAGCDHPEILNHCRQPADHARGCWCLDLLLEKA